MGDAYDKLLERVADRNPDLARRLRDILRRFEMVSEGTTGTPPALATPEEKRQRRLCHSCMGTGRYRNSAGRLGRCPRCWGRKTIPAQAKHKSTQPHHESKSPRHNGQPEFTHWLTEFATAPNMLALEDRVTEAEEAYATLTGRRDGIGVDQRTAEATRVFGQDGAAMEEVHAQRVLSRYAGKTAAQVARLEGDSRLTPWIEKVRRLNGYDDHGRKQPDWYKWDRLTRLLELRVLRGRGLSQRQAADELNVPRSTIQEYWTEAGKGMKERP